MQLNQNKPNRHTHIYELFLKNVPPELSCTMVAARDNTSNGDSMFNRCNRTICSCACCMCVCVRVFLCASAVVVCPKIDRCLIKLWVWPEDTHRKHSVYMVKIEEVTLVCWQWAIRMCDFRIVYTVEYIESVLGIRIVDCVWAIGIRIGIFCIFALILREHATCVEPRVSISLTLKSCRQILRNMRKRFCGFHYVMGTLGFLCSLAAFISKYRKRNQTKNTLGLDFRRGKCSPLRMELHWIRRTCCRPMKAFGLFDIEIVGCAMGFQSNWLLWIWVCESETWE